MHLEVLLLESGLLHSSTGCSFTSAMGGAASNPSTAAQTVSASTSSRRPSCIWRPVPSSRESSASRTPAAGENRPNRLRAGSLPGEGRGRGSPRNWSGPSGYCLDLWILVWTPGYSSGSPGYVSGPPEYWSAHLGYWSGRDPLDISLDTLDTGLDTLDTGLDTLDAGLGTLDTGPDTLNTGLNTLDTGLVGTPWISVWTPWILVWTPWILVWTPWKLVLAEGLRV